VDLDKIKSIISGKKKENISEAERNRRLIISLIVRGIILLMLVILIVYAAVSLILGSSLFLPNSAEAVLNSAAKDGRSDYYWISESRRRITFKETDVKETQLAWRDAIVNNEKNRFQARIYNVLPDTYTFWSNGWEESPENLRYTAGISKKESELLSESGIETNYAGFLITDPCTGQEAVPSSSVSLPSIEYFKEAKPTLETDKGSFLGQRSWIISFQPTKEIIEQMLWLPFWEKTTPNKSSPKEWRYIFSDIEKKQIKEESYKESKGLLWVTRDGRQLAQVLIEFKTDNRDFSSSWELLGRIKRPSKGELLSDGFKLPPPEC
jgi:hypothetical protein